MPTTVIHPIIRESQTSLKTTSSADGPALVDTPSGLAILEIQGTFQTDDHSTTADSTDLELGTLIFGKPSEKGTDERDATHVELLIGQHQRLTGQIKKLDRPYAVIRQKTGYEEELEMVEIVKYKILFTGRPEPVGSAVDNSDGT